MAGTGSAALRPPDEVLLRVEDLVVEYPSARGHAVQAVSGISFDLLPGETVGLVGESGCGKSTTGRAILQRPRPNSGRVTFEGQDLTAMRERDLRKIRPRLQLIFQDPISSINPRRQIADVVAEPLKIWPPADDSDVVTRVDVMLGEVGLDPELTRDRLRHELSGGQCQRVSIARSLMLNPRLIICDEPVSALDVSVQAQILNILEDMKARHRLTMLFIAHDLAVVKNVSDRVIVMYLGKICEVAPADSIYSSPAHHYTAALLSAVPTPDPDVPVTEPALTSTELPSPIDPPSGCRFRTRCPRAEERCALEEPELTPVGEAHYVACHFPLRDG